MAYYPFNSDFNDKSRNNFNGKPTDVILTGSKNKACFFNGRDAFIEVSDIAPLKTVGQLSVSCWISPFAVKPCDAWISKVNDNPDNSQWRMSFSQRCDYQAQFTIFNNDWIDYDIEFKFEMRKWYHVIYLIDNVEHKATVYINGNNLKTFAISAIKPSDGPVLFGYQKDDQDFFLWITW